MVFRELLAQSENSDSINTVSKWFQLGSFYNRIFRFKVSDPVNVSLFEAVADMEVGI